MRGCIRTRYRHPGHLLQRARQREQKRQNQAHDAKDDRAGPVVRQGVHHDNEGQDMAAHDKDQEQQLRGAKHLAPDGTEHDLTRVSHAVDMRITQLELADHVAGVGGDDAKADDEDDSPTDKRKKPWLAQGVTACGIKKGGGKGLSSATGEAQGAKVL